MVVEAEVVKDWSPTFGIPFLSITVVHCIGGKYVCLHYHPWLPPANCGTFYCCALYLWGNSAGSVLTRLWLVYTRKAKDLIHHFSLDPTTIQARRGFLWPIATFLENWDISGADGCENRFCPRMGWGVCFFYRKYIFAQQWISLSFSCGNDFFLKIKLITSKCEGGGGSGCKLQRLRLDEWHRKTQLNLGHPMHLNMELILAFKWQHINTICQEIFC